jgi:hypothetical protein
LDNAETERVVYEAAVRGTQDQAAILDGLRTRAGTVLAAAALVSSFLGGQALRTVDHLVVFSTVGAAFAAFIVSAVLTLAILWPFEFRFILSPSAMLQGLDDHAGATNEPTEFYRALALQLEWRYDQNARKIRLLQWAFQLAIVFLVLEVAAWIVVLWRD